MNRLHSSILASALAMIAGCGKAPPLAEAKADSNEVAQVQQKPKAASGNNIVDILVPKMDIPQGTRLDVRNMFTVKPFPRESVPFTAIFDPVKLEGKVTGRTLTAWIPVTERDLFTSINIYRELQPGYRAMGLRLAPESAAAGFIQPGARVDVVTSVRDPKDPQKSESRMFLQNISVLAVNHLTDRPEGEHPFAGQDKPLFVTLMLRPEQVERLALEVSLGSISLVMRKPGDAEKVETRGATGGANRFDNE